MQVRCRRKTSCGGSVPKERVRPAEVRCRTACKPELRRNRLNSHILNLYLAGVGGRVPGYELPGVNWIRAFPALDRTGQGRGCSLAGSASSSGPFPSSLFLLLRISANIDVSQLFAILPHLHLLHRHACITVASSLIASVTPHVSLAVCSPSFARFFLFIFRIFFPDSCPGV